MSTWQRLYAFIYIVRRSAKLSLTHVLIFSCVQSKLRWTKTQWSRSHCTSVNVSLVLPFTACCLQIRPRSNRYSALHWGSPIRFNALKQHQTQLSALFVHSAQLFTPQNLKCEIFFLQTIAFVRTH